MEEQGFTLPRPISQEGLSQLNDALQSHLNHFSAPQDKQVILIRIHLNEAWLQQFMLSESLPTEMNVMGTSLRFEQASFILKKSQKPTGNSVSTESIPWHQDTPHEMISWWVPLENVGTKEGGLIFKKAAPVDTPVYPIQIAPGNYGRTLDFVKMNTTKEEFEKDCVALSLVAGQPVLFHARTPHCSMPNYGDSWRSALVFRYIADHGACLDDETTPMEEYGSIVGVEYSADPDGELTLESPVFHTGAKKPPLTPEQLEEQRKRALQVLQQREAQRQKVIQAQQQRQAQRQQAIQAQRQRVLAAKEKAEKERQARVLAAKQKLPPGQVIVKQQQQIQAQQQQIQAQQQQIQAQQQRIQALVNESTQLQNQVNQLLQENQDNTAQLAQLQARLAQIRTILASFGVQV